MPLPLKRTILTGSLIIPYRVALVPSVCIGQFARNIATRKIYSGILEEGFTHVYEAEHGSGILIGLINRVPG